METMPGFSATTAGMTARRFLRLSQCSYLPSARADDACLYDKFVVRRPRLIPSQARELSVPIVLGQPELANVRISA